MSPASYSPSLFPLLFALLPSLLCRAEFDSSCDWAIIFSAWSRPLLPHVITVHGAKADVVRSGLYIQPFPLKPSRSRLSCSRTCRAKESAPYRFSFFWRSRRRRQPAVALLSSPYGLKGGWNWPGCVSETHLCCISLVSAQGKKKKRERNDKLWCYERGFDSKPYTSFFLFNLLIKHFTGRLISPDFQCHANMAALVAKRVLLPLIKQDRRPA